MLMLNCFVFCLSNCRNPNRGLFYLFEGNGLAPVPDELTLLPKGVPQGKVSTFVQAILF